MRPTETPNIHDRRGAPEASNRPITNRMRRPITDVQPRTPSRGRVSDTIYRVMAQSPLTRSVDNIAAATEAILAAATRGATYDNVAQALENEVDNLVEFAVHGDPFKTPQDKLDLAAQQLMGAVFALTVVRQAWNIESNERGIDIGLAIEVTG